MDAMVRRNACAASSAIYTDHLPPSGRTYALSVSEAEDIRTFGLRKTHLDTILLDLSRYLLLAGIRLAHSGHLRADGYTIRLADLLYDPIVEQLRGNAPGGVARVPELVTYIPLANTDHSDFIKLNFRSPYFSSIPLRVKFCRRAQKLGMGGGFMSQRGWVPLGALLAILVFGITSPVAAQQRQFVPNSQSFWANSKNWTSNYGPAYRDTVESPTQLLPCSSQFALCFHSGAEPLPCTISKDGRSAQCKCTVATFDQLHVDQRDSELSGLPLDGRCLRRRRFELHGDKLGPGLFTSGRWKIDPGRQGNLDLRSRYPRCHPCGD